jgi:hypothetical protein
MAATGAFGERCARTCARGPPSSAGRRRWQWVESPDPRRLLWRLIQAYGLLDRDGAALGRLARQLTAQRGPLPPGVLRAYDVSFQASAGVAVRALALATLIGIDTRLR